VLILERRRDTRPVLFGAVALGLLVLASPAHGLIHAILCGGVLCLWRAGAWLTQRNRAAMARAAVSIVLMGIMALLLSSPALLPALLNLDDMIRFIGDRPPVTAGMPMPFEVDTGASLVRFEYRPTMVVWLLRLHALTAAMMAACAAFLGIAAVQRRRG
jgi:hypothetical protein